MGCVESVPASKKKKKTSQNGTSSSPKNRPLPPSAVAAGSGKKKEKKRTKTSAETSAPQNPLLASARPTTPRHTKATTTTAPCSPANEQQMEGTTNLHHYELPVDQLRDLSPVVTIPTTTVVVTSAPPAALSPPLPTGNTLANNTTGMATVFPSSAQISSPHLPQQQQLAPLAASSADGHMAVTREKGDFGSEGGDDPEEESSHRSEQSQLGSFAFDAPFRAAQAGGGSSFTGGSIGRAGPGGGGSSFDGSSGLVSGGLRNGPAFGPASRTGSLSDAQLCRSTPSFQSAEGASVRRQQHSRHSSRGSALSSLTGRRSVASSMQSGVSGGSLHQVLPGNSPPFNPRHKQPTEHQPDGQPPLPRQQSRRELVRELMGSFLSGTSLATSVQSSEGDRHSEFSVDGPSREPSIASQFMTLVEGDGPTSREMFAQLGMDVMMAHARAIERARQQGDHPSADDELLSGTLSNLTENRDNGAHLPTFGHLPVANSWNETIAPLRVSAAADDAAGGEDMSSLSTATDRSISAFRN